MNKFALLLSLLLSTCAAEPAFALHAHDVKPIKWYLVFVWETPAGEHVLNSQSVKKGMPQFFDSRKKCEGAGRMVAENLTEKYGGFAKSSVTPVCIAARTKLELRQHLRFLDLNFGGQPA